MFRVTANLKLNESEITRALRGEDGPVGRYGTNKAREATKVAKSKANVDTGLMQSKINTRTDRSGQELAWLITVDTEYAEYVHEGNNNYAGNPFVYDAIREVFG